MVYDPIPTPAGNSGQTSIWVGVGAWVLAAIAAIFLGTSLITEDPHILEFVISAGRVGIGLAGIACIAGLLFGAHGVTLAIPGEPPDPGLRRVYIGFGVNTAALLALTAYIFLMMAKG